MMGLLYELLNDSSKSDRDLAKILGVSQPTVSRMKRRLLEEKIINRYSVMPNMYKLGYRIMALTFVKTKNLFSEEGWNPMIEDVTAWVRSKPNIVFCDTCRGMGMDGGILSFHKSYEEFDEFISEHNFKLGKYLKECNNVLFKLGKKQALKPFDLKYLAEDR